MVLASVAAAALAVGLGRGLSSGEPSVQWHAPPECPTADEVAARATRLGAGETAASVDITAVEGGYAAVVTIDDASRTLHSASCDELATAVALLLAAVAREPDAIPPERPPEPPPQEPADPDPTTDVPDAVPPREAAPLPAPLPTPRRSSRVRAFDVRGPTITAVATAGVGLLPRVDVGGGLGLGWAWRRATVEIGGWVLAPREESTANGASGRVMIGAAALGGCGRFGRAWLEARTCGAIEAGGSQVRARGVAVVDGARNPWVGVRAAVRLLAWVHPRIAPALAVGGVVPLLRTDYVVGDDVLFSGAPVVFSATLGLEIALGRRRPS